MRAANPEGGPVNWTDWRLPRIERVQSNVTKRGDRLGSRESQAPWTATTTATMKKKTKDKLVSHRMSSDSVGVVVDVRRLVVVLDSIMLWSTGLFLLRLIRVYIL